MFINFREKKDNEFNELILIGWIMKELYNSFLKYKLQF